MTFPYEGSIELPADPAGGYEDDEFEDADEDD